jgi:polyisoprenoid-binding protein YceI
MKKSSIFIIVALATSLFSFIPVETSTWTMDTVHSKVGFTITHLMISDVEGYFKTVSATITSGTADFTNATAEMSADVNSISTDNEMRDNDLKSPSYFDAARFPTVTFKSTSFKMTDTPNTYLVKGDLTMHGITRPVTLTAVCRMGTHPMTHKQMAGFKITGKVNRKDYGVGSSKPEAILSNDVMIYANAEFIKK